MSPIDVSLDSTLPGKNSVFTPYFAREECCSTAGCSDCERQYNRAGIGIVIAGRCEYRSQTGTAIGVPGTMVFGNVGEYFRVRHFDSTPLRRLVVWFDKSFVEGIAEAYGIDAARFGVVAQAPGKSTSGMYARMQALARGWGDADDAAQALVASAMTIKTERDFSRSIATRDRRRILSVVGYIEEAFFEPCSVDDLAKVSGLGRYHFMRLFKAVTGQSANQYVINARLRAAAARLAETKVPVSQIALDVGFNDISHFNTCFRSVFDCTPRQMRKSARA